MILTNRYTPRRCSTTAHRTLWSVRGRRHPCEPFQQLSRVAKSSKSKQPGPLVRTPWLAKLTCKVKGYGVAAYGSSMQTCSRCNQPARDVSAAYLRSVRDTRRGQHADSVYFCGRTCKLAWLLIKGEFEPVDRRSVEGLTGMS